MYKTIILEMLENRPMLHQQLRQTGTLLATVDQLAQELKASHHGWIDRLAQDQPQTDLSLLPSQAMELALSFPLQLRPPPTSQTIA